VDENDRPELMRELALADHGIRGGAVMLGIGVLAMLGGFVAVAALGHQILLLVAFIGMFFAVVGGLIALDSLRERHEARRALRELDQQRALPEARILLR
jgi:uncharacterized membrane protein HdeD (DUF308 family)